MKSRQVFFLVLFSLAFFVQLPITVADNHEEPAPKKTFSLGQQQHIARAEEKLNKSAESTNKVCETNISPTIDWSNFDGPDTQIAQVAAFCADALVAVKGLCGTQGGKDAIQSHIKKVNCSLSKGEKNLSFSRDTLHLQIDLKAKNYTIFTTDWLKRNI